VRTVVSFHIDREYMHARASQLLRAATPAQLCVDIILIYEGRHTRPNENTHSAADLASSMMVRT
jgi:hypothetical protein